MATIEDVARAAGVSASTVSYVLSGKRSISAPTRQRVEKAIQQLGYRPHAGARALASSRTNVLALMAPLRAGVEVNVIMQFVSSVVLRARDYSYDVLLLTQDDVSGAERVGAGSMVDGIIVMDVEAQDARLPSLARLRQPTVLIGLPRSPGTLSCVDLDFEAAGRLALDHLVGLGHRHVAFVGPPPEVMARHTSYADRVLRGFSGAARDAGIDARTIECEGTAPGAAAAVDELLAHDPALSAVLVHNESALPHVVARFAEHGRRVPDDLSVMIISPPEVATAQPVPLTSIDIPTERVARVAVEMTMARIDGDEPAETRLLTPVVTDRGSTLPAVSP
ncbi:LacI family DNA-binding transcriptional regulator [Oerskovia flava]|uniref:LacI family DNA-binding transcriptional regulator n=1 Tax=Oerskovia flava TaxID=2986422 RepID=UPI00223FA620|nr:LacI family DNA-binding transcriptional regulator [Oerskovia sp. JB1-3-2]